MRFPAGVLFLLLLLPVFATAQTTFPGFYGLSDLSPASPGALRFGLYGFDNPALLASLRQPDAIVSWTANASDPQRGSRWGLFSAVPSLGFGMVRTHSAGVSLTDYRLALGFGDRSLAGGIAYGWASGDREAAGRSNSWMLGLLLRPDPHVSVGITGAAATADRSREAALDLAVRPMGTELVTLFGDYALARGTTLREGSWSTGAVLEPLPGVRLTGRYFDSHAFSIGLGFSLGQIGASAQSTFNDDRRRAFNTWTVRLGAHDRTVLQRLMHNRRYLQMSLYGPVKYQTYRWFDDGQTLAGILQTIGAARSDPTVAGIAINAAGMSMNRTMIWEIRNALAEFRATGKKVVMYVDRAGIDEYHLASVADRIVMDPSGTLLLQGYRMGRTFLKGTLDKLGIGYDEWRFFTYKSASESFSRESMSPADREQRQKLVDDFYAIAKEEICASGRLTPVRFDSLVNSVLLVSPRAALAQRLVDTLGRWEEARAMVRSLEGEEKSWAGAGTLEEFRRPYDDRWGEPAGIAVIYALGACDMDEGIKARSLVKDVEAAVNNPRIRGIVLRVDSPGGDAMAADYIAEALRRAKGKKPVIVSQGLVAASGGYWLSMYGDTIVANPGTITGSIGVIGGWMYNRDLKEKLGMSTDHVRAGDHADLGFGFTLPLLGIGLPDRNLTVEERAHVEQWIRELYTEFVGKVAEGRVMDRRTVDSMGQGRVWSGRDGKRLGLVDELGGLNAAIRIARARAGIGAEEEVEIVELPRPGLVNLQALIPSPFAGGLTARENPWLDQFLFRVRHNGIPMPLLPLEDAPAE